MGKFSCRSGERMRSGRHFEGCLKQEEVLGMLRSFGACIQLRDVATAGVLQF